MGNVQELTAFQGRKGDLGKADVTLRVGGETLPELPDAEKLEFCRRALTALDVLESVLVRVTECLENGPVNAVQVDNK